MPFKKELAYVGCTQEHNLLIASLKLCNAISCEKLCALEHISYTTNNQLWKTDRKQETASNGWKPTLLQLTKLVMNLKEADTKVCPTESFWRVWFSNMFTSSCQVSLDKLHAHHRHWLREQVWQRVEEGSCLDPCVGDRVPWIWNRRGSLIFSI